MKAIAVVIVLLAGLTAVAQSTRTKPKASQHSPTLYKAPVSISPLNPGPFKTAFQRVIQRRSIS